MAVLGALWSLLVTGVYWISAGAFSLTDRFNGPQTPVLIVISLLEAVLLLALIQAYRLRSWLWAVLLLWFVVASGLLAHPSTPRNWLTSGAFLFVLLAPVSVTMLLLLRHQFAPRPPVPPDGGATLT
jgi:hypothetical protein